MQPEKISYLKTTLAGFGLFGSAVFLTIYWFAIGEIRIPLLGWILFNAWWLNWPIIGALVLIGPIGLTIALGGLLALYGDSRQTLRVNGLVRSNFVTRWTKIKNSLVVNPRVGDYVEVRSAPEILSTLDGGGCLDGLPFMPEMANYCGRRFKVFKRADKVIDMVNKTGVRRISKTVLLQDIRCDGQAHGGCQAGCYMLWKEDWLRGVFGKPSLGDLRPDGDKESARLHLNDAGYLKIKLPSGSRTIPGELQDQEIYRCQATEIFKASSRLPWWDIRQDLVPLWSGNITLKEFVCGISINLFNTAQGFRGGCGYPYVEPGNLKRTPSSELGLRTGELVRVKSLEEIEKTLDTRSRNRGLWFDKEMVRYCGRQFRILRRVERTIDEKTGKLVKLQNPCIILEGVTAKGDYHRFNPQNEFIFWREIWLERVSPPINEEATPGILVGGTDNATSERWITRL